MRLFCLLLWIGMTFAIFRCDGNWPSVKLLFKMISSGSMMQNLIFFTSWVLIESWPADFLGLSEFIVARISVCVVGLRKKVLLVGVMWAWSWEWKG